VDLVEVIHCFGRILWWKVEERNCEEGYCCGRILWRRAIVLEGSCGGRILFGRILWRMVENHFSGNLYYCGEHYCGETIVDGGNLYYCGGNQSYTYAYYIVAAILFGMAFVDCGV
jgi:hypothetical protein